MSITYADTKTGILYATPTEAERLARRKVEVAEGQRLAGGPGCAPWCRYHQDTVCYSTPEGIGSDDITVTREPGWGVRVQWWDREDVTLDEAEAFARRMLDLVAEARKEVGR